MHFTGYNFTGPGTKLKKRLNPDLTPKKWSKPVNRVDNAAYHHDICYLKNEDTATRNAVCDKNMLKELEGYLQSRSLGKIGQVHRQQAHRNEGETWDGC